MEKDLDKAASWLQVLSIISTFQLQMQPFVALVKPSTDKSGSCGPGGMTRSFDLPGNQPIQGAPTGICLEFLGFRRAPHQEQPNPWCVCVLFVSSLRLSTREVSSFGDLATCFPLSIGFNEAVPISSSSVRLQFVPGQVMQRASQEM